MYHSVRDVDSEGGYECVGTEIFVLSPRFFCKPKTALNKNQ